MKKKRALSNHDNAPAPPQLPTTGSRQHKTMLHRPINQTIFSQPNTEVSRRSVLQRSALGVGSLGLLNLLQQEPTNAAETQALATSLSSRPAHFVPRAKRVIHFFLNGGPSHVDTFDPKPMLKTVLRPDGLRQSGHRTQDGGSAAISISLPQIRTVGNRSQRAVSADCCAHR